MPEDKHDRGENTNSPLQRPRKAAIPPLDIIKGGKAQELDDGEEITHRVLDWSACGAVREFAANQIHKTVLRLTIRLASSRLS